MKNINLTAKTCFNTLFILFGITTVASDIALANAGAITAFLGQSSQEVINDPNGSESIIKNFSDYSSIQELKQNSLTLTSRITEEGATLIKNENKALPLTKGAKVNLYSSSSVNFIYSGGGSSFAKKSEFISLKEFMELV